MKIGITLLIYFILSFSNLYSQQSEFNVVSGFIEQKTVKPYVKKLIKFDNQYFMVRWEAIPGPRNWDYVIEKFDENMDFVKSVKVSGVEKKVDRRLIEIFKLGQSIAILYAITPANQSIKKYKLILVNQVTLEVEKNIELFSFPQDGKLKEDEVKLNVSKGGKFFTISYMTLVKWVGSSVVAVFHFSERGELLSDLLKSMHENKERRILTQILPTDAGSVYLLFSHHKDVSMFGAGSQEFKAITRIKDWQVLSINDGELEKYKIRTSKLAVNKMLIAEGEKGGIIGAAGFWATDRNSVKNTSHFTKGVYTFKLDPNSQEITYSDIHPFSYDLVFTGLHKKYVKLLFSAYRVSPYNDLGKIKKEKENYDNFSDFELESIRDMKDNVGFPNFVIRKIVERNGEILFLGSTFMEYGNGVIVYTRFSKDGSTHYDGKIGMLNDEAFQAPFQLFSKDGAPAIFFQDSYENADPSKFDKKPYIKSDRSVYSAMVFGSAEKPKRQVACKINSTNKILKFHNFTELPDKSEVLFILEVEGNKFKFGSLK